MRTKTYRTPAPTPFALLDRMLAEAGRPIEVANAPVAYDLIQTGETTFRLELPVAGFAEADLEIEAKAFSLAVRGRVAAPVEGETVVHAGIVRRPFERTFTLAEHVTVKGARLERGLLVIELARELPEALKPRTIAIGA